MSEDAAHEGRGDGKRLVLLRHAKSGYPDGVADHERPLAKRGRRDAPLVGRWLGSAGYVPDAVICSTAVRARETWSLAAAGLAATAPAAAVPAPQVRFEPRVYEATVLGLLMLVREFSQAWQTVLLVGHNPGVAELAVGLANGSASWPSGFPTAFAAVLQLPGSWADVAPESASLVAFTIPANLSS